MTQDVAFVVLAVIVLLLLAVLAARVRESELVELGLSESTAEAEVARHLVFGVAIVAVGASPAKER